MESVQYKVSDRWRHLCASCYVSGSKFHRVTPSQVRDKYVRSVFYENFFCVCADTAKVKTRHVCMTFRSAPHFQRNRILSFALLIPTYKLNHVSRACSEKCRTLATVEGVKSALNTTVGARYLSDCACGLSM